MRVRYVILKAAWTIFTIGRLMLCLNWLAHTKRICPRCNIPFSKGHLGKTKRRSFYCESCQKKYPADSARAM